MKDLGALLAPRSIAVIGASQKGGRATGAVQNLLDLGFTGSIHPVNPNYDTVLGQRCYPSVEAIPGPVDLVAIGIPGEQALEQLRSAHRKGVKAAVIFASGFAEAGDQGKARQAELQAFARETGMLICGPNCLGVVNLVQRSCGYSSISPKDVAVGRCGGGVAKRHRHRRAGAQPAWHGLQPSHLLRQRGRAHLGRLPGLSGERSRHQGAGRYSWRASATPRGSSRPPQPRGAPASRSSPSRPGAASRVRPQASPTPAASPAAPRCMTRCSARTA